jgi:hypothetical protein
MSTTSHAAATASPVPHRWLDNFLLGLSIFAAALLMPMAGFVVWGVWPRPMLPEGDLGAAARGYAVIIDLFAMVGVWLIGLTATLVGLAFETRPGRRRGLYILSSLYMVWVVLAAGYLVYCQFA